MVPLTFVRRDPLGVLPADELVHRGGQPALSERRQQQQRVDPLGLLRREQHRTQARVIAGVDRRAVLLASANRSASGRAGVCPTSLIPHKSEKAMRRMLFSIPAIALACATSSPNSQVSGTRRAQDDAQKQYQGAANAQKHAADEQQKAEQAEREVTKAQKTLADAQARLEGQRAKAAQAQQEAGVMGRDAERRGTQAQEQATQKQGDLPELLGYLITELRAAPSEDDSAIVGLRWKD